MAYPYDAIPEGYEGMHWEDDSADEQDAELSLNDLLEHCLLPTVHEASIQFGTVMMWCLIFRASASFLPLPAIPVHLLSATCGLAALTSMFGEAVLYFPALATVGYAALGVARFCTRWGYRCCGPVSAFACVVFIISSELAFSDPSVWHMVRGAQMLVVMKIVSVGFDVDSDEKAHLPNASQYYGYILHVGCVVFGPWISFKDYLTVLTRPSINFIWVVSVMRSGALAMFCFAMSSCVTIWTSTWGTWKWWLAYNDAFAYRMSHYFISFMSEATVMASGIGCHGEGKTWSFPVAVPSKIELPRSLVQVVVYWNIPMHVWLKEYVFRPSQRFGLGGFPAILLTYVASAMLHGLNGQLWAVLLSLGLSTYVEHILREKLSSIYDACIRARPCKEKCSHHKTFFSAVTLVWNTLFFILAISSLAYLGVMFDSDPKLQEQGYDLTHTFAKWLYLDFTGHWIALSMYVVYKLS